MTSHGATAALRPADLGCDPWDPSFVADPYPALARLRDEAPLIYDERTSQWLVSRWKPRLVLRGLEGLRVRA